MPIERQGDRTTTIDVTAAERPCGCPALPELSRRSFLKAAGATGVVAGLASEGMFTRLAFGATPYVGDVLVVLSLRGGMDSLQAVVPAAAAAVQPLRELAAEHRRTPRPAAAARCRLRHASLDGPAEALLRRRLPRHRERRRHGPAEPIPLLGDGRDGTSSAGHIAPHRMARPRPRSPRPGRTLPGDAARIELCGPGLPRPRSRARDVERRRIRTLGRLEPDRGGPVGHRAARRADRGPSGDRGARAHRARRAVDRRSAPGRRLHPGQRRRLPGLRVGERAARRGPPDQGRRGAAGCGRRLRRLGHARGPGRRRRRVDGGPPGRVLIVPRSVRDRSRAPRWAGSP